MTSSTDYLLHVALYSRGNVKDAQGNPAYHWALNVSSRLHDPFSIQESLQLDATDAVIPATGQTLWRTRRCKVKDDTEGQVPLGRFTIAELVDLCSFTQAVDTVHVPQDDPHFNCSVWVRDVIRAADEGECFERKCIDWMLIEAKAETYMAEKRRVGRWEQEDPWDQNLPATWSMLEKRETVA